MKTVAHAYPRFRRWLMLLVACCAQPAMARDLAAPLWENEPLAPNEGVISLEIRGEAFPKGDEPLQILTKNVATQKLYIISQPLLWTKARQRSLYWKLPAGKYEIVQISRLHSGRPHVAVKNPRFRFFQVASFALTDLGVWLPRPAPRRTLTLTYHSRVVQSFLFPKGDDSIDAIIDGFTGRRLEAIGGRGHQRRVALAQAARTGQPIPPRNSRAFDLAYRMELNKYQRFNASLMPTIRAQENQFRQCQRHGKRSRGDGIGSARFAFALDKERGDIRSVSYQGGTIASREMIKCLQTELGRARFPIKTPVNGKLTFDFKRR